MGFNRFKNCIMGSRGSAMIMAIVTITVLMLLGLAVITVSMGTLRSNAADAATNDAYYAAESGANSGLDQLKLEVSRYYTQMMNADSDHYPGLFNNFASGIAVNAQTNFADPDISGGDTRTTFSVAGHESSGDIYEFLASTVSTMADGTKYKVEARLKVKRVDVSAKSWFIENASLVVGGTLGIGNYGFTLNGGNAYLGKLTYNHPASWNQYVHNGGTTTIDPLIKDSINDVLNYPGFSDPVISNPTYYITSNTTMTDKNYPWITPVSVDTANGVSLVISNNNIIPAGIIRVRGDLTINSGGNVYSDLYCQNFTDSGRAYYGDIYSHGNFKKTGGDIYGDVYCDGNVTLNNISVHGSVICNGSITINGATALGNLFAGGPINLSQLGTSGNVLYSKSSITLTGASVSAIMFAGGDINFIGGAGGLTGAIFCKNNIPLSNAYPQLTYNATEVAKKLAAIKGTFFDPGGGGIALDTGVFREQSITAIGRIN